MTGFLYSAAAWLTKPLPRTECFRGLLRAGSKNQPDTCQIDSPALSNDRTLARYLRRATYPHSSIVFPAIYSPKAQEHCANIKRFADPVRSQMASAV